MSKLEALIAELCPNGVEYVHLWRVTIWDKKFNSVNKAKQTKVINYPYLLATKLFALRQNEGNIFLLSTGEKTGWTTEELAGEFICEGEVVTIPWGKSRPIKEVIKYYKGKFVTADNRIATSINTEILNNKYLYYCLITQGEIIDSFYRGSGIKHPSMKDVLDLQIPLPPLPIQEEIVRILDTFTELTAELTAELNARKKQYEYYRDLLLTFGDEVEWKKLGELVVIKNGKDYKNFGNGKIPVYGSGGIMTYIDTYIYDKPSVLIPRKGSIDKLYYVDVPFWNVDTIFYTEIKNNVVNPKYIFYYLQMIHLEKLNSAGGVPSLTQAILKLVPIPLPSLNKQGRIVSILDEFDFLINDISKGLPAEIKARQKQYEYYRDKLLNFPEVKT